ncbi:MAG: translation initiation factor IF-3, partial [Acidobacteriota bacterium]
MRPPPQSAAISTRHTCPPPPTVRAATDRFPRSPPLSRPVRRPALPRQHRHDTDLTPHRPFQTEPTPGPQLLRFAQEILRDGNKVKATVRFKGREITHKELGMTLLDRLTLDLADCGIVEFRPRLEGMQMMVVFGPKKS